MNTSIVPRVCSTIKPACTSSAAPSPVTCTPSSVFCPTTTGRDYPPVGRRCGLTLVPPGAFAHDAGGAECLLPRLPAWRRILRSDTAYRAEVIAAGLLRRSVAEPLHHFLPLMRDSALFTLRHDGHAS